MVPVSNSRCRGTKGVWQVRAALKQNREQQALGIWWFTIQTLSGTGRPYRRKESRGKHMGIRNVSWQKKKKIRAGVWLVACKGQILFWRTSHANHGGAVLGFIGLHHFGCRRCGRDSTTSASWPWEGSAIGGGDRGLRGCLERGADGGCFPSGVCYNAPLPRSLVDGIKRRRRF